MEQRTTKKLGEHTMPKSTILWIKLGCALLLPFLWSVASIAQEVYYGQFSGEPKLQVKTNEGKRPSFILLEEFSFKDPNGFEWTTPEKWEVDGASIPRAAWTFIGGPLSGAYLHASVIHDKYCDTRERTAHDTHRNFFYGMRANGVPPNKAKIMYWAVRTFGPSWIIESRIKEVKRKIGQSPKIICSGSLNCYVKWTEVITKVPVVELVTESIEPPNLSDAKINSYIKGLDTNLDLEELDRLSDTVRVKLESSPIQSKVD